jgi:hypothetical protein
MAETRQIRGMTIHFQGNNAAELAKSFDGSLAGSQLFRDAMNETARTQRHIYVGSSLDDLRDQPGFDRAGFHPNSPEVQDTNAFGHPSGADSYFIVMTNQEHHLAQNNGQVFPGSRDLSLVHELLHPSQIMRTLAETGSLYARDSEARTQMREQKIAEELGKTPGKDFPDVFESGPYGVRLDSTETQPRSTPPVDSALPVNPMKYEGRTPPSPTSPPESEGSIGLFSGKPMRFPFAAIFDTRNRSAATGGPNRSNALDDLISNFGRSRASPFDIGRAASPFARNPQDTFDNRNGVASSASGPGDGSAPPTPAPQNPQGPLSLNDAYLEYLKRLNANQSQAPKFDTNAPSPPLASPDDSNFSGGLPGRLAALPGVDPQNPGQLAPPPSDDDLRAFYGDPGQAWFLQRQR